MSDRDHITAGHWEPIIEKSVGLFSTVFNGSSRIPRVRFVVETAEQDARASCLFLFE